MVKAVIFDMFETLVTLFTGKTYFGENIAEDVGVDPKVFRKEWHSIEDERSTGKYTIKECLEVVLKRLGVYSDELVELAACCQTAALAHHHRCQQQRPFAKVYLMQNGLRVVIVVLVVVTLAILSIRLVL